MGRSRFHVVAYGGGRWCIVDRMTGSRDWPGMYVEDGIVPTWYIRLDAQAQCDALNSRER